MKKGSNSVTGLLMLILVSMMISPIAMAQKIDDDRMKRDISVAENVLATLIKQQFSNQRTFFPLEVSGSYQAGYGVTFMIPADFTTPIVFSVSGGTNNNGDVVVWGNESNGVQSFSLSSEDEQEVRNALNGDRTMRLKEKGKRNPLNMDSIRDTYNLKVIDAAKAFLVDYGDMITQLGANEKIVITNQGNQPKQWVNQYFNAPKRTHLSIEFSKADMAQYKQGKISREQALNKVKVVNTETVEEVEPDLELLASIFNRLYRRDLSTTYFADENVYFERLKDFGVIYYMKVYSSIPRDYNRFAMPTIKLDDLDLETRNKKVAELYPKFEKELKENVVEYGRTLKSLKQNEVLVFQVQVTQCPACKIPSTLELTVPGSALLDLNAGKIDKNSAMSKISIKKGTDQ